MREGLVEVNRTHTAVEMAYKYASEHGKEEVTLPEEFKHHTALFSDEEANKFPPACRDGDHKIILMDTTPTRFNCKVYPLSRDEQEAENKFIDENLEKGYIAPSDSSYGFSTFMVPKKDSKEKRYIIDYRPLNAVTQKDVTPLPNLKQCIENLQGMELFSKFDIHWGYNNIRIQEGDQWKAAFKTRQGLFKSKVMFFGMSNSPASFQRFMNGILEELYEYFEKKVCQLPSWVCQPSLFQPGSQSSLVLAFKNPDGSITQSLLSQRYLYAFRAQCKVKKWCQPPPSPTRRA